MVFNLKFQSEKYLKGTGIAPQGPVRKKVWQTWDALNGGWFTGPTQTPNSGAVVYTIASYVKTYPNARILNDHSGGGVRLQAGGIPMADNFLGNADAFTIGINGKITVYDFEVDSKAVLERTVKFTNTLRQDDYTGAHPKVLATTLYHPTVIKVTDNSLNGWAKDEEHLGKIRFTNGPSTPPLQKGSIEFYAPENGHRRFVRMENSAYSGLLLSSITQLTYSTFIQKAGSKRDAPFVVLLVDADGDGIEDTHMFFDPRYQYPKDTNGIPTKYGWFNPKDTNDKAIKWQGSVQQKVWQKWDALHGAWITWSTGEKKGDTNPPMYLSLIHI